MYDGLIISGTELVSLIESYEEVEEFKNKIFTIKVNTLANPDENRSIVYPTAMPENKSDAGYINPTGKFEGSVKRNTNGLIESITFKQIN